MVKGIAKNNTATAAATTITPCDSIEGPIVKLKSGQVIRVESETEAKKQEGNIKEILFLGDILISYGDFLNRAHTLVPPGYCPEWWIQELERAVVNLFGNLDIEKLSELIKISTENIKKLLDAPLLIKPSAKAAILISTKLKVPLHPYYTYHWNLISTKQRKMIITSLRNSTLKKEGN